MITFVVENLILMLLFPPAKINIGLGGRKLGQEAIQLHGGMGVTDEMDIGQYFKRLTMLDTFLGNSDHYLSKFSDLC